MRKSMNQFEEKTFENFEPSNSPKKKTIIFEDEPVLEKKATNEEVNYTDRNDKDIAEFYEKSEHKIDDSPTDLEIIPRRVTCSIPSKKFEGFLFY